jgi:uncharacterized protein
MTIPEEPYMNANQSTPEKENSTPFPNKTDINPEGQPNHLIDEKSPYLLQHAYNPVKWYPWGENAFEKARSENKLIFLSIGYSSCHWCHVMESESFNDEEVGRLMNEVFVAIKVDREERPDIDHVYMNAAMVLNGGGGWPLNVLLTPNSEPFFAATYIPKETRFGRKGLLELIPQIQELWLNDADKIHDSAGQISITMQSSPDNEPGAILDGSILDMAHKQLSERFDSLHGGFGNAPKFPQPSNLLFLMRYWKRTGDEGALSMVEATLQAMRQGGMYDHVGFGFHRYSTDAQWFSPHFEKMLYDQAMLAMAYTEAFQITGDASYEQTAREVFTYVLRDMTSSRGAFYTAEDADSEGLEGKFYLWTEAELRELLSPNKAEFVLSKFNPTPQGNFEGAGMNILHLTRPLSDSGGEWENIRKILFEERETRIHPFKDDKILTDWNGLMIAALAKASRAFGEPVYAETAVAAADFLLDELKDENGRLLHRFRDGDAGIQATADDYAFFIWGLIELYETTFDVRYLEAALTFQDQMIEYFEDPIGGFFLTATDGEELIQRPKEIYDGALPSGNSVSMLNLLRLGRLTGSIRYEILADATAMGLASQVGRSPAAYVQFLSAVDFGIGPSFEVVIAGDLAGADTEDMLTVLRRQYLPNKVVLLRPPGKDIPIVELAAFTKYHSVRNDRATAYVCLNYICQQPTNDVEVMLLQLSDPDAVPNPG